MNCYKIYSSLKSFCLTLFIASPLAGSLPVEVLAQNKSIYTNKKNQVTFQPPKGGKPQQTVAGASRGAQCPLDSLNLDIPMTPLLPIASQALTTKSHPTMLVYVPQTSTTKAMLSVRDENEDYDYQAIVPMVRERAGIVSLTLPEDAPSLAIDREYQWSLILMCDDKLGPDSPVARGNIKRVAVDISLDSHLGDARTLENAAEYGKAGIWYDTVSILAQLKITKPQDREISSNWENLLKEVGLEKVAKAEFVE